MRTKLASLGVPADSLSAAVEFLNKADRSLHVEVCTAFGLNFDGADALTAARFVADACIRLGDGGSVDKVVGHVRRKMTGMAPTLPPPNAPVVVVGAPVVDNREVTIAPVIPLAKPQEEPVRRGRGRRKNGKSDFCKAVAIIEANMSGDRSVQIGALLKAGITKSSAAVYLWRYHTKGERD